MTSIIPFCGESAVFRLSRALTRVSSGWNVIQEKQGHFSLIAKSFLCLRKTGLRQRDSERSLPPPAEPYGKYPSSGPGSKPNNSPSALESAVSLSVHVCVVPYLFSSSWRKRTAKMRTHLFALRWTPWPLSTIF